MKVELLNTINNKENYMPKMERRLIAYTQQGRSHKKTGTPCQDIVGFSCDHNIFVLADGAGSSEHALEGAKFSVQTWLDLLKKEENISMEHVDVFQERLIEYAKQNAYPLSSLSSTLCVLKIDEKNNTYDALSIGDSLMGYGLKKEDAYEAVPIFSPENGEFANETWMTTSKDIKLHTQMIHSDIPNLCIGFFMMSDGPAKVLYQKNEKRMAPAVSKLFHIADVMPQKDAQIRLEKFIREIVFAHSSDDLSYLQVMIRKGSEKNAKADD